MKTQVPVKHMFTVILEGLRDRPYDYVGPFGRRRFEKASGGTVQGTALDGEVLRLLSTDYGRLSDDGTLRAFHASLSVQDSDGVVVLMQVRGRSSPGYGLGQSRVQILFQAPDGRYGWFNGVQAIGYGREDGERTIINVFWLTGEPVFEGQDDASAPDHRQSVPAQFLLRRKSEHVAGATRHIIAAPLGTRYFTLAEGGGKFEGPRVNGEFVSGYSWSPHRMLKIDDRIVLMQYDVETLLEADDGTPILMSYTGTSSDRYGAGRWMTASLFETPNGPHDWLNGVQAVGYGRWAGDGAEYHVYALL